MQLIGSSSLAQTTFPGGTGRARALLRAPRLDALVRRADGDRVLLEHYHRGQGRPDETWVRGATLTSVAAAPAALAGHAGALVALVPQPDGLAHHAAHPSGRRGWRQVGLVTPAVDAVALAAGDRGLDALVAASGAVTHWWAAGTAGLWRRRTTLPSGVVGAPALVTTASGLLAVLPTARGAVGFRLTPSGWAPLGVLTDAVGDPALALLPRGEVLLAVASDAGVRLARGRPDAHGPWPADPASDTALGPHAAVTGLSLVRTALGAGLDVSRAGLGAINLGGAALAAGRTTGWVQALVQEGPSLYQWRRQLERGRTRWVRSACVRLVDAGVPARSASAKVAQLSGERDTQPLPGASGRTLSSSESTSGVRGTDLGVRVDVHGTALLLFGDTHWRNRRLATRDAVARVVDPDADRPRVEFHGGPLRLQGLGTTMAEYDVPLDAFALGDRWYAFATSNHFARHQVMGRSVLARALDAPDAVSGRSHRPFRFRTLATVSELYFVNITCQPVAGDPSVLALWGSGAYRADDLRLALFDPRHRGPDLGLRFFAGLERGRPTWSGRETDAVPVVRGAFGEVSVRYVPALRRYLFLSMSGPEDPVGGAVVLRTAPEPWGPWSERLVLFDWITDGLCLADPTRRFICALGAGDPVGDRIFRAQADRPGGAYAPYLFDVRVAGGSVRLRYTLSTWNPYQVVLMEHTLDADELGLG